MKYILLISFIFLIQISNIKSQNKEELLQEAIRELNENRNISAIELFTKYIDLEKSNSIAYFGRAKATYWVWRLRNEEDSCLLKNYLADIYTSYALDSTNSDCNYWIAENIEKTRNPEKALEYYCRAIRYYKESENYFRSRAYCYMDLGEFKKAINDFKVANKLVMSEYDKDMRKVLTEGNFSDISLCYAKLENLKLATAYIEKSIRSNPTHHSYQLYYATFLTLQNKPEESLKIYKSLIKKNPYLGIAYLFVGNIYNLQYKENLAQMYYAKAISMGFEVNENTKNIKKQIDMLM
jgi:tetratricopeptide (TPR) repeat protein